MSLDLILWSSGDAHPMLAHTHTKKKKNPRVHEDNTGLGSIVDWAEEIPWTHVHFQQPWSQGVINEDIKTQQLKARAPRVNKFMGRA